MLALLLGAVIIVVGPAVAAFPIRVRTATELSLNPRVVGGRHSLSLTVLLRDDRRAAVEGRTLTITITGPGGLSVRRVERTDAQGEVHVEALIGPQARVLVVDASSAEDDRFAAATAHAEIDVDAPFVTVELSPPTTPLSTTAAPPPFNVRVNTGSAAWLSPRGLPVDLVSVGAVPLRDPVAGVTDDGGQAMLVVPAGAFPRAGIYTLRPRVEVSPGHTVEGAGRTVLVRADTTLTAALVSDRDDPRARLRGRLRTATDEPVGGAPVRLMRGDETVAAVRTDAAGEFVFEVDLERTQLAGQLVRARFEPADPWFVPAESAPLRVGEAPSPPIHWGWMLAPWALLALATLALAARRGVRLPAPSAVPVEAKRDVVVRTGAAPDGVIEVVVEAYDRSTGAALPGARYAPGGADERPVSAPTSLARARSTTLVVSADGYEPRRVEVGRLGSGRHAVRVGMLSWREALFDRARPALSAAADGAVMPTPREAVGATLLAGQEAPWVALLERGAYGPEAPDAQTVVAVERALGGGEATSNDGSDAVDAVN
ncbi:MAG: hypothetical protein Q8S73_22545 [Deltaproteobacteria bacterium]|nr:hypothetical protein [Myxococcales bacterium]MDP3216907.1 hypothetical protein [Deltaproteobacteria bacterium]